MGLSAPPISTPTKSSSASALDRLLDATHKDMQAVNALILARTDSHVDMVPELARYLIEAGGKRLRPMLTIAAARLFSTDQGHEINFAAAVEFMHNATLLHDDVVDESDMRRGQPAARKVWGNQASVLVGDFLLGQAFLMMVETRDMDALGVLSSAAAVIAEGEVLQLSKAGDLTTTRDDYERIIYAKTATLFEASTLVGAMAAGADEAAKNSLGLYGLELGRAFQLVDDVLDYGGSAGTLGKNTGDDLREGKMTLPIILTFETGSKQQCAVLTSALGNPDVSEEIVVQVQNILTETGALAQTLQQAERRAQAAKDALADLPKSTMRTILEDIADFCVARAY